MKWVSKELDEHDNEMCASGLKSEEQTVDEINDHCEESSENPQQKPLTKKEKAEKAAAKKAKMNVAKPKPTKFDETMMHH